MSNNTFFGFEISSESFEYLNDDPELSQVSPEHIRAGLEKAKQHFDNLDARIKQDLFEYVLDLCEECITEEMEGIT